MTKTLSFVVAAVLCAVATQSFGQSEGFQPVTSDMLANPPPGDWLMINRTYDEQRFSPLDQINKSNAGQLQMAWSRGLPTGTNETTPIVHQGVMYTVNPGGGVIAINATNGDLIWEYEREYPKEMADFVGGPERARSKGLAIYEDMIYFLAPRRRHRRPRCQDRQGALGQRRPEFQGARTGHLVTDRGRRQGYHQPHLRDTRRLFPLGA